MAERVIVEAHGVPMWIALHKASLVAAKGRVSDQERSYCYLTVWPTSRIEVRAVRNKASDRFIVTRRGENG